MNDLRLKTCLVLLLMSGYGCQRSTSDNPASATTPSASPSRPELIPVTNMVQIHAGRWVRGKHLVTLTNDYWMAKYEVTQGEYTALTGKNPSHFPGDTNRPVEKVTYFDAVAYCTEISQREQAAGHLPPQFEYRLPTEAEWEYACRAGTTNLYSFGGDASEIDRYAWTLENSGGMTHPVGQKQPNAWGLYDMHGNVWEWCQDWFGQYPKTGLTNPAGPTEGKIKVFRGGGWNHTADMARAANRFMMSPSNGIYFVGFRLALAPKK